MMAQCVHCNGEAALYIGGDVPMCVECSDAHQAKSNPSKAEQDIRATLLQDILEATVLNNTTYQEFETTMGQSPSSSTHPTIAEQVKLASNKLSIAGKRMMTAHDPR